MESKEEICSRIKNTTDTVDSIFNECSNILGRNGLDYDRYDRTFFSLFRKLIVRWKGMAILIENNQAENADVFMRTIFELQGCLEFILLGNDIELISKRVISYEYNSLLQRIKVLSVSSKEKAEEAKEMLRSESVFRQVVDDIAKKQAVKKSSRYWANLYSDKPISNFTELMEYIDQFYSLDNVETYSTFWKSRYKNLSTEIHSNNLQIRNMNSNYYETEYTEVELFSVLDSLIMFDTVIGDFIWYLEKKYNVDSKVNKKLTVLRDKLVNIVLHGSEELD